MTRDETIEKVARAICAERCAWAGEPPCWKIMDGSNFKWPPETCDEPGCMAFAQAAVAALEEIRDLPGEINTGNYNHDDAVRLNDAFIETYHIARAALEEKP
jgi:hypothetical protein